MEKGTLKDLFILILLIFITFLLFYGGVIETKYNNVVDECNEQILKVEKECCGYDKYEIKDIGYIKQMG